MKRSDLEHPIRAAGSIASDTNIVVIGSQAILDQFPNAPPQMSDIVLGRVRGDFPDGSDLRREQ